MHMGGIAETTLRDVIRVRENRIKPPTGSGSRIPYTKHVLTTAGVLDLSQKKPHSLPTITDINLAAAVAIGGGACSSCSMVQPAKCCRAKYFLSNIC